jgi:AraC family transcriptional activator of pobA
MSRQPLRIKTISEFHRLRGLPKPEHPLISLVDYEAMEYTVDEAKSSWVSEFYSISIKRTTNAKIKYGQKDYDFDEGVMFFMAPNQVFSIETDENIEAKHTGWLLLIHPDFLWNATLAKNIKQYEYFDYSINEALFLSEKEETNIYNIIKNIQQEYHANLDKFSQQIIISQIETLLNYSERFYHRQFLTRKKASHQILDRLDEILKDHFSGNSSVLPTVQFVAETLNLSSSYLNGILKSYTGQTTQQHIHNKLINKAKEILSTTTLSVSEIAYQLGFEHSQSFSKLFKTKTDQSPLEFRASFN